MEIFNWLQHHWMQIGLCWFAVQNFLKALQDTLGAMPKGLNLLGQVVYLMQGIGAYLFLGQRPQTPGGSSNA